MIALYREIIHHLSMLPIPDNDHVSTVGCNEPWLRGVDVEMVHLVHRRPEGRHSHRHRGGFRPLPAVWFRAVDKV